MKQSFFRLWFSNGNYLPEFVNVSVFGQGDALILAQAERIKAGRDYTLLKVEEVEQ